MTQIRATAVVTALLLAAGVLATAGATTASATSASAAAAAPADRWCAEGVARPCVVSLTVNGQALAAHGAYRPTASAIMEGAWASLDPGVSGDRFQFAVTGPLKATDTIRVVYDTGLSAGVDHVDRGRFRMQDVDIWTGSAGERLVAVAGKPVLSYRSSFPPCQSPQPAVPKCTPPRPGAYVEFSGRVVATGDWGNSGIDQTANARGGDILTWMPPSSNAWDWVSARGISTRLVAPRFQNDGRTPLGGYARYLIPFDKVPALLGVRNPAGLRKRDLVLRINGRVAPNALFFRQDPDGGAIQLGASGFTFPASGKGVSLTFRYRFAPTRPRIHRASRTGPTTGRLLHTLVAAPSGAPITAYGAMCSGGGHTVTATGPGRSGQIQLRGLRINQGYQCRVRAYTRSGVGPWSAGASISRDFVRPRH